MPSYSSSIPRSSSSSSLLISSHPSASGCWLLIVHDGRWIRGNVSSDDDDEDDDVQCSSGSAASTISTSISASAFLFRNAIDAE